MTDIFVHIGLPKTGTTSIQSSLFSNRKELENLGVLYPSAYIPPQCCAHHQIPLLIFGKMESDWEHEQKKIYEYIKEQSQNFNKIVISSESFWKAIIQQPERTSNFFKQLSSIYNTILILTLREFSEQLNSAYTQHIKTFHSNGSKIDEMFIINLIKRIQVSFSTLLDIAEFIPPENFRVIDTTQKELTIEKFLSIINVEKSSLTKESDYKNEKPFLEVLRLIWNISYEHPNLKNLPDAKKALFLNHINRKIFENSTKYYRLFTAEESLEINSQVVDFFEQINSITIDNISALIARMKHKPVYSEAEKQDIINNLNYLYSPLNDQEKDELQTLLIKTMIGSKV